MVLKKETDRSTQEKSEDGATEGEIEGIVETYMLLWKIVRLPSVGKLILILLTAKVGVAMEMG